MDAATSILFDSFADDLLAERSIRPLIIVGASKVDHFLLEILRAFFLPKVAKQRDADELLEGDAPLATFSARIKVCRRLGLIDSTLYMSLDRLRLIRNYSAHSVTFDQSKSPVRDHFAELRKQLAQRRSFQLTKARYFDSDPLSAIQDIQSLLLTLCVLLQAILDKTTATSGNKHSLRIAAN